MSQDPAAPPDVLLQHDGDDADGIAALAERYGTRVGLEGVLANLNRQAERADVPGRAVDWGFQWDRSDRDSQRWWPQGLTGSGDASETGEVAGRRLLIASWYARQVDGEEHGSRISVIDLETLAYRHVLLVTPGESFGEPVPKPLLVHAGGLAWTGDWLHVAATRRGILALRPEDIVEVEPGPDTFGHRFVLPVRRVWADQGSAPLRYSFCSIDRGAGQLVAGEYGGDGEQHRLARFPLDPATGELGGGPSASDPVVPDGPAAAASGRAGVGGPGQGIDGPGGSGGAGDIAQPGDGNPGSGGRGFTPAGEPNGPGGSGSDGDTAQPGDGNPGSGGRSTSPAAGPGQGMAGLGGGGCAPYDLDERGLPQTQGAVVVDGTWYLTTSHGRRRPGQLHVGAPGEFHTIRRALPPGPEDLTWDPATERLWSLSEHPGRRFVFCMERPTAGS